MSKLIKGSNDLATVFPNLLQEWDYNKNNIAPNEVTSHSGREVWWICRKGHEWKAPIHSRTSSHPNGCPYCSNKKVLKGYNDFATTHPTLVTEWCYDLNTAIQPDEITAGSKIKVAWRCHACNNVWTTAIQERTRGRGCPYCSKKEGSSKTNEIRIKQRGNTIAKSAVLLAEWDYKRNGLLDPAKILTGSDKRVWWVCSKGHEWQSTVKDRKKNNCPYCSCKKVLAEYNDLATTNLQLADEWHPTKNGSLSPTNVTAGSNKSVWWLCRKGHEWQATINSRNQGRGCPICSEEISTSFPEQAMLYYIKQLYPDTVSRYDEEGFEIDIFIPQYRIGLEYDGQYYHDSPAKDEKKDISALEKGMKLIRIREPKCPQINGSSLIVHRRTMDINGLEEAIIKTVDLIGTLTEDNRIIDINIRRDEISIENMTEKTYKSKSLMAIYPDIAKDWNYEKNGRLTPDTIAFGSAKTVWWKCQKCGNEWKATVNSRTNSSMYSKRGCPVCGDEQRRKAFNQYIISQNGSLLEKYPKIVSEWNYNLNKEVTPDQISSKSKKKVWWICSKGHNWQASVCNRANGTGCPYCANKKVLSGYNDLATLNPILTSEWDYTKNGDFKPTMVTCGSAKKVWWKCSAGHEWQASVYMRTRGTGCPICASKRAK